MNDVGIKELLEARKRCAQIITHYGEQYLPIFERLEHEIDSRSEQQQLLKKAIEIGTQSGTRFGTQKQNCNAITFQKSFNINALQGFKI